MKQERVRNKRKRTEQTEGIGEFNPNSFFRLFRSFSVCSVFSILLSHFTNVMSLSGNACFPEELSNQP